MSNFPIIFLFIGLFGAKFTFTSPLLQNDDKLELLMVRVNGLQSEMGRLLNLLEEEKILRENLQTRNSELESKIEQLAAENIKQNERFDNLRTELEAKIDQWMIRTTKKEDNDITSSLNHARNSNNDETSGLKSDSLLKIPPSSCRELSTIGHYLDGIYMVANPDTNKIEAVYCDFGSSTLSETLYGNVDVKIKSVHFFVQRSADLISNTVIPFYIERLNVGGAMNLATGVFTVPVDGIYHFEFSGMKDLNAAELVINFQVNGANIGISYATLLPNFLTLSGINASLRLKTGDQVRLVKTSGTLNDANLFTHFSGWLVEEDLAL